MLHFVLLPPANLLQRVSVGSRIDFEQYRSQDWPSMLPVLSAAADIQLPFLVPVSAPREGNDAAARPGSTMPAIVPRIGIKWTAAPFLTLTASMDSTCVPRVAYKLSVKV